MGSKLFIYFCNLRPLPRMKKITILFHETLHKWISNRHILDLRVGFGDRVHPYLFWRAIEIEQPLLQRLVCAAGGLDGAVDVLAMGIAHDLHRMQRWQTWKDSTRAHTHIRTHAHTHAHMHTCTHARMHLTKARVRTK